MGARGVLENLQQLIHRKPGLAHAGVPTHRGRRYQHVSEARAGPLPVSSAVGRSLTAHITNKPKKSTKKIIEVACAFVPGLCCASTAYHVALLGQLSGEFGLDAEDLL